MGMDFPATVAPFILRGVTLYGIDSLYASASRRRAAWDLLASRLTGADLDGIARDIGLKECVAAAANLLAGHMTGRYRVDVRR